jgi:hypothetical protein
MKQQYKKIPNSWKSIRRYDQPTKTLSPKAIDILAVAMYQANKYNQAILTHKVLKDITGSLRDQNRRLIKQLGFIFNLEFSRCLTEGKKKYNDAYKLTFTKNATEILENPEDYFAEFEDDIAAKDRSKKIATSQQNTFEDRSINANMSQQKSRDIAAKMLPCDHPLLLYIKKLIYIINKKTNVDVDIDLYSLIMSMNWNSLFSQNTPEQIEAFSQFIAKKSPFYFYSQEDSQEAFRDLHKIDTMDKLRTRYLTEFQKIGMAEAKREYAENMKRFKC